jgi:parallel beta-helix repeat protein
MSIISRAAVVFGLAFAGALAISSAAHAGTAQVNARDNAFEPQEVRIDPGDRIRWDNVGFRDHTVTADDRSFNTRLDPGGEFTRKFRKKGYYFYHCTLHGQARSGMWGVVVVGNPGPPGGRRPRIVVPDDFLSIQRAVDEADPGSTIVVKPGVYRQEVEVSIPDLVIKGVDRFRTVLNGGDTRDNGISVDGFGDVTVKNLTIRNFVGSGILLNDVTDYTISGVDLIKNRTYGLNAIGSNEGLVEKSFGWGSGDSAFRIAQCRSCSTLVDSIQGKQSFIGLTVDNAFGVVVRASKFVNNGAGIVSMTMPDEPQSPNMGVHILSNDVHDNNYTTIPEAGLSTQYGLPFGTGIWLAGANNNLVEDNAVEGHERYGILVTRSFDTQVAAASNEVVNNQVEASGVFDLAWDGYGDDDCFEGNVVSGATGPADIQTTYACSARPFTGTPFDPVADDVTAALVYDPSRQQLEPPEPNRPPCQRC